MPYVRREGRPDIYYEVDDYTDPWIDAPYLILQHGFGRSSRFWYSWVPYLSRYYKVVRPDFRGLGKSSVNFDLERGVELGEYLNDLDAIIDDLGVGDLHYCGESLGGIIGIAYAAARPERIRTLSLVSCTIKDHAARGNDYLKGQSRLEAIEKLGVRAWAHASGAGRRFPKDANPEFLNWFADEMGKSNVNVLLAMNSRLVPQLDVSECVSRVRAPILGIFPTEGTITTEEQLEFLNSNAADIKFVRLQANYHSINIIQAEACARHVLDFVSEHDGISRQD